MADKGMSDKERAFLAATRREIAAKTKRREVVDTTAARPQSRARPGARPAAEARTSSPLDAQTVLGWDHPAAQQPASGAEDKWSRVAALMESERRDTAQKRAKARRGAIVFLIVLLAVILVVGARALSR